MPQPTPEGYSWRVSLKSINPAALEGGRVDGYQGGCGGASGTIPLTLGLALSSEISPVRGVSLPEHLVRVSEPRLVTGAELVLP